MRHTFATQCVHRLMSYAQFESFFCFHSNWSVLFVQLRPQIIENKNQIWCLAEEKEEHDVIIETNFHVNRFLSLHYFATCCGRFFSFLIFLNTNITFRDHFCLFFFISTHNFVFTNHFFLHFFIHFNYHSLWSIGRWRKTSERSSKRTRETETERRSEKKVFLSCDAVNENE